MCSNHRKIRISFDAANTELMYKIRIKYQYASRTVRACARFFQKRQGQLFYKPGIEGTMPGNSFVFEEKRYIYSKTKIKLGGAKI